MASPEPGTTEPTTRPAGIAGDGDDRYPTYHDARSNPHPSTGTKPTDTDLPRSRRTTALPFLIGLILFALAVIGYLVMGGLNFGRMTEEALTPGGHDKPPPAPATPGQPRPAH